MIRISISLLVELSHCNAIDDQFSQYDSPASFFVIYTIVIVEGNQLATYSFALASLLIVAANVLKASFFER